MTNQEIEYLLRHRKVPLDHLDSGGAEDGDLITWVDDGQGGGSWQPLPPDSGGVPGTQPIGIDLPLHFSADVTQNVAVIEHGLGSLSPSVTLLTTAFDGLWAVFATPWRVLDSNRIEVRAALGFTGPARAVVMALV